MKLVLSVEAPEGGDPQNPVPISAWGAFEPVLEEELLDLFPEMAGYGNVEVSISILSPEEIRAVNRDYRECDEETDVLSFPMWEEDGRFAPAPMLAGSVLPLGDVMICPGEAKGKSLSLPPPPDHFLRQVFILPEYPGKMFFFQCKWRIFISYYRFHGQSVESHIGHMEDVLCEIRVAGCKCPPHIVVLTAPAFHKALKPMNHQIISTAS